MPTRRIGLDVEDGLSRGSPDANVVRRLPSRAPAAWRLQSAAKVLLSVRAPYSVLRWSCAVGACAPSARAAAPVRSEDAVPLERDLGALLIGSKIHLITERSGLPISVGIPGAAARQPGPDPACGGHPPIRSRRGADDGASPESSTPTRATGYAHPRRWLRERGTTHRIVRKGVESSQRLGRHRWTVERTMAWLAGCRRLHRRYERKADHFLACTLICYRRLAK